MNCTAVEIAPRCVLTAAHCDIAGMAYYSQGSRFDTLERKIAVLASSNKWPTFSNGGAEQDLAVMRLAPRACDEGYMDCVTVTWSPRSVATGQLTEVTATIVGYGHDRWQYDEMYMGEVETGIGTRREGSMLVDSMQGSPNGGYYELSDNAGQYMLSGDSGGPLLATDGSVHGIASTYTMDPTATVENRYTSLVAGDNGTWLARRLSRTCAPRMHVSTDVVDDESEMSDLALGTVLGLRNGSTEIECNATEMDCSSRNRSGSVVLTATAGSAATFVEWGGGAQCPCDGSTASTCTVSDSFVGDPMLSMGMWEAAWCPARFQRDMADLTEMMLEGGYNGEDEDSLADMSGMMGLY